MAHDIAEPPTRVVAGRSVAGRGGALVVLGLWVGWAIWSQWGVWPQDLSAIYVAAHLWQTGQYDLIYAAPPGFFGGTANNWAPVLAAIGAGRNLSSPYVYPPLWAVLLGPLTTHVGAAGFLTVVKVIQVVLLAASVSLAGRLFRPAAMSPLTWAIASVVMLASMVQPYTTLWHSQPTILVTFLILGAFCLIRSGRPVAAGLALALAAASKVTPAAFALLLLIDRQYRAFWTFCAGCAALGLLSLALAGVNLNREFLAVLNSIGEQVLLAPVNTSLLPAAMAAGSWLGLLPPIDLSRPLNILAPVPAALSATLSALGLGVTAAFLVALRRLPQAARLSRGLLALGLIVPLFGPLGWLHYFLLPVLLLPGIVGLFAPRVAVLLAGVVIVPALLPVVVLVGRLPWPAADFVWISAAGWLALLAALYWSIRRDG